LESFFVSLVNFVVSRRLVAVARWQVFWENVVGFSGIP